MKQFFFIASLIFISQLAFSQVNDCKCFNGIDSNDTKKPSLTINFSNGINLSVCGYEDERISETEIVFTTVNIFNCETGELLLQSGHPEFQIYNIRSKPDTLFITIMSPLPSGKNWKWQLTPITQQLIYPNSDTTIITSPECIYMTTEIDQQHIDQFFSELEQLKGKGYNDDLENLIAKLGVLTLNGNTKARNILNDFRSYIGYALDG